MENATTENVPKEHEATKPEPFLKWAGGKRSLLPKIIPRLEALLSANPSAEYWEPFLGGGAVFFELAARGHFKNRIAHLSDINEEIINVYRVVRDQPLSLIRALGDGTFKNDAETFYAVRSTLYQDPVNRAARTIYLNKTCFNGLYRTNSKGLFNTPFGKYKNPTICDSDRIVACSKALASTSIVAQDFSLIIKRAMHGDVLYLDPPYAPVSKTSNFTGYCGEFGTREQTLLAKVFRETKERAHVLLSNSTAPLCIELYHAHGDYEVEFIECNRAINSKAERRGAVQELLVYAGPKGAS